MKRALPWFTGLLGIAALGRWLSRRKPPAEPVLRTAEAATDPAEALRRRLADVRQPETEAAQPEADESLDERRARVHARAREAIDAMGDDGTPAA